MVWRGEGHRLETLAPINLGYSKRNCVLNMRLRDAYCENQDGGSWDTEMPHTAGEEDYPSQLCGISHFSQIIPALDVRTDLQDLDSSLSWTQLELSRVMDTQFRSGIQRKNIGRALHWHCGVRTWGLSPYINWGLPGLHLTWSHCDTPGHSGGYYSASPPGQLCREWAHPRVGWTGRDQGARNTGNTSHMAKMTSTVGANRVLRIMGEDLNENYFSKIKCPKD